MCGKVTIIVIIFLRLLTSQWILANNNSDEVIMHKDEDLMLSYTLAETALRIFEFYNSQYLLLVLHDDSMMSDYFVLTVQNISPIIILNSTQTIALTTIPQSIYFFCNDTSILQRFALDLSRAQSIIDRRSQILVILTVLNAEIRINDDIYNVMMTFWKAQFHNVVVLYSVPRKDSLPSPRAIRCNLFCREDDFLEDVTNKLILGDVFFDPMHGLCGYPLLVGMRNTSFSLRLRDNKKGIVGFDEEMVLVLSKIMHVSIEVQLYNEEIITHVINSSKNINSWTSQFDIWISSTYIFYEIMDLMEFSYPHMKDDACIVVPKGHRQPQYFNILYTFNCYSFTATMASIVILSIIMTIINKIESQFYHTRRYSGYYLFNVIQIFFNSGITLPRTSAERITFASIAIFVYFMEVMLQSFLTSNLAVTHYYPDVNTLQELLMTDYQILMPDALYSLLIQRMDPDLIAELLPITKIVEGNTVAEYFYNNNITYGILLSRNFEEHLVKKVTHMIQHRPLYHIMEECPMPGFLAYYAPRRSPFLPIINYAVLRIIETGFTRVWQIELSDFEENVTTVTFDVPNENVIIVQHFLSAFVIYLTGIVLSISVFIGEVRNNIREFIRRM